MKKVIDFLCALRANNHRDWFEAHRDRYAEALAEFNAFAQRLIDTMPSVDPSVAGLTLRDCTYRIYRDTRFSNDKTPYKTHMGVYICPKGKKSGYAGYSFHVEPEGEGFPGNSLLSAGLYMPSAEVLHSVRDELADNGAEVIAALEKAAGFVLDTSSRLSRPPKGFSADSPYIEYIKLKDFSVYLPIGNEFLTAPDLLERTVAGFRKTVELNRLLNRAVTYAFENR